MPSEPLAAPGWRDRTESTLRGIILALVLVLPGVLGFVTSYVLLPVVMLAALYLLTIARDVDWAPDPLAKVLLAVFVTLVIIFAVTADDPRDLLSLFNFLALPLYWPLSVLMRRGAREGNALRVAGLALLGTTAGLVFCVVVIATLGTMNAPLQFTDYIRVANTAVILGFMSAALGFPLAQGRTRWIFLLGPVIALAVVLLAGARIAMLAYLALILLLPLLLMRRKLLAALLSAALLAAAVLLGLAVGGARVQTLVDSIVQLASSGTVTDFAVGARLALYEAGWQAFLEAPLLGHGWANMMPAAAAHLSEADAVHAWLPHLHNEALNFAVLGGLVGVVLYLTLLIAPVTVAVRASADPQRRARILAAAVVVAAYFVMGLTDTMLSFELHTALYVGLFAVLFGYGPEGHREGA